MKKTRDAAEVARTLAEIRKADIDGTNLFPPVLDAVSAYASLGEICGVLREVFGEYREEVVL